MSDFNTYEKCVVRELACRLCLANDVVKLKPLTKELKRKLKKLFGIEVKSNDNLPRAICHDCLQELGALHRFAVKVEKMQNFLELYRNKTQRPKSPHTVKINPEPDILNTDHKQEMEPSKGKEGSKIKKIDYPDLNVSTVSPQSPRNETGTSSPNCEGKQKKVIKLSKNALKQKENMPLEELIQVEGLDKKSLSDKVKVKTVKPTSEQKAETQVVDTLDPVVLVNGKPAKQGSDLDRQITLFYRMQCCICKEEGFTFKTLMKHYKERHGVVGYVSCCGKKFHYFNPKQIIEHMAYHLQPGIFGCPSCHEHFQSTSELREHTCNGGSRNGKLMCLRCGCPFPTYRELGRHLVKIHRSDMFDCDYCGKQLKAQRRRRTINDMEDVILCAHCTKIMKTIEKQTRLETKSN